MTTKIAPPLCFRSPSLPGGHHHPLSMAALMQSNNEPVAISNPLSGPSNTIISSPQDSVAFLKQSTKPESNLSSIASAGLHVSRSRDQPSSASNMATATTPTMEHREQQDKGPEQNSSQVAREALGASEKSHSINDSMPIPSDHMQVDSHTAPNDAYGSSADNNAPSLLNAPTTVASPGPMEDSASQDGDRPRHRDEAGIIEEASNKAFSYPMPTGNFNDSRRGLSLPNSGFSRGQRSPGAKKHRCPYCSTEFTRHHNLKSHLLTHSQEKPYVCQTCQSRFRRLHDLKRHTKLHTGERPHICPKCGRRFARGDALARHNKGQGGCAGRRSSMGSFAPDEEYGDGAAHGSAEDAMEGLVYAEPERMDEEEERRLMPSIRRHDASVDSASRSNTGTFQSRQPSTYPPIAAGRPSPGSLFPPPASHGGGSSTSPSPISQPGNLTFPPAGQPSGTSVFQPNNTTTPTTANNNITESPKPLSPNALSSQNQTNHGPDGHHRAHSPSVAQQPFQQQPFSRPPPQTAVPTTHAASSLGLPPPQPGAPQLPPPPGLNASDSRFALHGPAATAAKHTPSHSHSSNHSGGPLATAKSGTELYPDPNTVDPSREDKLWAYIRSVQEEVTSLRTEVAALRAQLAVSNGNTHPPLNEANHANAGPR